MKPNLFLINLILELTIYYFIIMIAFLIDFLSFSVISALDLAVNP